jgi:hypothetical protein
LAKKERERDYPERGWVSYRMDKKTRIVTRTTNPLDDQEYHQRQLQREHEEELIEQEEQRRKYEVYINNVINNFEYDLAMGNRDDFYCVEDYLDYLDSRIDDDVDDENYEEEYDEDSQEEHY